MWRSDFFVMPDSTLPLYCARHSCTLDCACHASCASAQRLRKHEQNAVLITIGERDVSVLHYANAQHTSSQQVQNTVLLLYRTVHGTVLYMVQYRECTYMPNIYEAMADWVMFDAGLWHIDSLSNAKTLSVQALDKWLSAHTHTHNYSPQRQQTDSACHNEAEDCHSQEDGAIKLQAYKMEFIIVKFSRNLTPANKGLAQMVLGSSNYSRNNC